MKLSKWVAMTFLVAMLAVVVGCSGPAPSGGGSPSAPAPSSSGSNTTNS